jgi:hypothetical protein
MAERSGAISHTTLHEAAVGARFPSWATTREFVRLCNGDESEWRVLWEEARPASSNPWGSRPGPATAPSTEPVFDAEPVVAPDATIRVELAPDPVMSTVAEPEPIDAAASGGPATTSRRASPRVWAAGSVMVLTVGAVGALVATTLHNGADDATARSVRPPVVATSAASPASAEAVPSGIRVPGDSAKFIADITFPDGSTVKTNEHFVKIWQIKNVGKVAWRNRFMIRADLPADTGACSTPDRIRVPDTIPGGDAMISVRVVASSVPERCWVAWKTVDAAGHPMFPGRRPIYFTVNVVK